MRVAGRWEAALRTRYWAFLCLLLGGSFTALRAESSEVSHRLLACEAEVEMLKNAIVTQEQAREAMEKEVSLLLKATKESLAENISGSARRQKTFDTSLEKILQDLKQLKSHSNGLAEAVSDLSKSMQALRENSKRHDIAIQELEQAMRALTLALNGSPPSKKASYRVKTGDSLEKIAKLYGMTLSELKELNNLKSSNIRPGQELSVR